MPPTAARKPQDHKPKERTKLEDFTWSTEAGEITIPALKHCMTAGFLRTHRDDTEQELMFKLIELNLDEDSLLRFDGLDLDEMGDFFDAWREQSDIDLGE